MHLECEFAKTLNMFLGHLIPSIRRGPVFSCLTVALLFAQSTHGQSPNAVPSSLPSVPTTNTHSRLTSEQVAAKLAELRAKAERGDPVSQNRLGDLLGQGQIVKTDLAEAAKWYRKSAEQGYSPGQFNLGVVYENGEGVSKDPHAAVKWYRKAAKKGYVPAEYNLGLMLLKGNGGKKDVSEGCQWIKKAAEENDPLAQVALAGLYLNGDGFPIDKVEAFAWLHLVSQNSTYNKESIQITCQEIQRNLLPNQLEQGLDRSRRLAEEIAQRLEAQRNRRPGVTPPK